MKIVWTEESLNRLINIEEFIADDSPARATKFISQIINKAEFLSSIDFLLAAILRAVKPAALEISSLNSSI